MRVFRFVASGTLLILCVFADALACAQDSAAKQDAQPPKQENSSAKDDKPASTSLKDAPVTRVTIEITGGANNAPIQNASVYVKYVEERTLRKDKHLELNVKSNREGVAHVPGAPLGHALIQIVAEGWKPFGRKYEITEANQVIKIHLDRPPKWY